MKKSKNKLFMKKEIILIIICLILSDSVFAQTIVRQIKDIETGLVVPFATIINSDKSIVLSSDQDGIFSIEIQLGTNYLISQIGYKSLTISAEQLLMDRPIQMEALSYELNPAIVIPYNALKEIYRAIDITYNLIYKTPFYRRCFKKDEIAVNNNNLIDVKAIIDIQAKKIHSVSKGALITTVLKGLKSRENIDNMTSSNVFPITNLMPISALNSFLAGANQKDENNMVFSRFHSEHDSIVIITYYPKIDYYDSNILYTSGQFIINKASWTISEINWTYDNKAIAHQNAVVNASKKDQKLLHELNCKILFSSNGLPSKLEQRLVYSLKNKSEEMFTWTTIQIYKDITKIEYNQKPSSTYNHRKFILQQKAINMPDFDAVFSQGFFNN